MKRKLRRYFVLLFFVWLILLLVAFLYSRRFENTLISLLKNNIDKHLQTEIRIPRDNIQFSLIKNFPSASLILDSLVIESPKTSKQFPKNLLVANKCVVKINLRKLLSKQVEIIEIKVVGGELNLVTSNNGLRNYDIWKSNGTPKNDSVSYAINTLLMENVQLLYADRNQQITTQQRIDKGVFSGSFIRSNFEIKLKASTFVHDFTNQKSQIVKNQPATLQMAIHKEDKILRLTKGILTLSGFPVTVNGVIDSGKKRAFAIIIKARKVDLAKLKNKKIRELYDKIGFKANKGTLALHCKLSRESINRPTKTDAWFNLYGASVKHKTGLEFTNSMIKGSFSNGTMRNHQSSVVVIDTFSLQSVESHLNGAAKIFTPRNPLIETQFHGQLNYQVINQLLPSETKIFTQGNLNVDVSSSGRLSFKRGELVNSLIYLKTSGIVHANELSFYSPKKRINPQELNGTVQLVNGKEIQTTSLNIKSNQTQLGIEGTVKNWQGFVTGKEIPNISVKAVGTEFTLADYSAATNNDNASMCLPDSIIFNTQLSIGTAYFPKFTLSRVTGSVSYKPYLLQFKNMQLHAFDGQIRCNGTVSQHGKSMAINSMFYPDGISVQPVFKAFDNFNQQSIEYQNIKGKLKGDVQCKMVFNEQGEMDFAKLGLLTSISLLDGELINYKPLEALSNYISLEELKHVRFDELSTTLLINDGLLTIDKTMIRSSAIDFDIFGEHHLNNEYKYHMDISLSDLLWKKAKKRNKQSDLGYVVDDGIKRILPLIVYSD
ncbi:MAG: hypothetical protein MI922_19995, partial [Bacteroidales bacterium]|nr:hypothetical protein [Bacteroidales bacterium]